MTNAYIKEENTRIALTGSVLGGKTIKRILICLLNLTQNNTKISTKKRLAIQAFSF
jgi:hypothetical protein